MRKVQRLFRKEVGPSGPKLPAPLEGEDIVSSAWRHAAAVRRIKVSDLD